MPRYQLAPRGVINLDTGDTVLPEHPAWQDYQAWLAEGNAAELPPPPAPPSLETLIAEKLAAIEGHAGMLRRKITDRASPSEMASWTVKLQEARAFQASGNAADAALLAIEADTRGVPLAAIVARVLSNSLLFSQMEARIAGAAGRHKDAVRLLRSSEDVLGYDIAAGWPRLGSAMESDQHEPE